MRRPKPAAHVVRVHKEKQAVAECPYCHQKFPGPRGRQARAGHIRWRHLLEHNATKKELEQGVDLQVPEKLELEVVKLVEEVPTSAQDHLSMAIATAQAEIEALQKEIADREAVVRAEQAKVAAMTASLAVLGFEKEVLAEALTKIATGSSKAPSLTMHG